MKYNIHIIVIFLSTLTATLSARDARFCNTQDELALIQEIDLKVGERCLIGFAAGQDSRCWKTGEDSAVRVLPHERFKGTSYPVMEGVAVGDAHGTCQFQPDAETNDDAGMRGSLRYHWHATVS